MKKLILVLSIVLFIFGAVLYSVNAQIPMLGQSKKADTLLRQMIFMRADPIMYGAYMDELYEFKDELLTKYGY